LQWSREKYDTQRDNGLGYPLSPAPAKILAEVCNAITRQPIELDKLFKPSTDSASLPVEIEKIVFHFGFRVLWGDVTSGGVFWPTLRGHGRQSNEPIFSLKFFFKTRLSSESLEPLIGFLAYLEPKLCHKKWLKFLPLQKDKNFYPYKRTPGLN